MNGITINSKVFKTERQAESFIRWAEEKGGDCQRMWGEYLF